jgi:hypothetical protein
MLELPADRRANCPRCCDQFPIRTFTEISDSDGVVPGTKTAGTGQAFPKARAQWSVKRAVIVALAMGVVGLIVGVVVYNFRGNKKLKDELEPPAMATAAIPADQLFGLGYLPADTNIAFAVQTSPVIAYSERMNKDPRDVLIQAGIPAKLFDGLINLGITLQDIEHFVGGTSIGDGAWTIRLSLVLVLRKPLNNEDEFLHKLKAKKQAAKARYDVEVFGILPQGIPLMLARISPTVWFFGWDAKDFKAVDSGGFGPGGKQFPAGLSQAIAEQVPPNAAVWLATNDEQWSEKPGVRILVGELMKKKEWLPVLARGRSVLAAFSLEETPRLRLMIKAADPTTGEHLRTYFESQAKVNDKVRHGGSGELAFYDAPVDPMNGFATITRFLSDAVKP